MTLDVYGVGNTLVDIQVQVSDQLLESLGFAKGMMTLVDHDTQQRVLQVLGQLPRNQSAGGSAANTILGIAGLGGRTAYAGKVGNDPLGQFCLEDMRANQVTVDIPFSDRRPLGRLELLAIYRRFASPQGFNSGDQFFNYLKDSFDALYLEGKTHPKMMSVGMHARILGRPGRIMAMRKFLEYVKTFDDVWFCTRREIADHWYENF